MEFILDPERITLRHSPFSLKDVIKAIPGRAWSKRDKSWSWPASPTCAQNVLDGLSAYISDQGTLAALRALAAQGKEAQAIKTDASPDLASLPPGLNKRLWKHQHVGYSFAAKLPGAMLAMDMGTGKSLTALALLLNAAPKRVLIVAPAAVVAVWPGEFAKHLTPEALSRVILLPLPGGQKGKSLAFRAKQVQKLMEFNDDRYMRVLVVNYEAMWQEPMGQALKDFAPEYIIWDESHRIKTPSAQASKFAWQLSQGAKRRLALTGTPMPHSPLDIFSQFRCIDPGVFGTSWTMFRAQYAIMDAMFKSKVLRFQNEDDLNEKFYSVAFRASKDILELPSFQHEVRTFDLSPKGRKVYDTLKEEFIVEVEGGVVTAANAMVKLLRLQQVTSGYLKPDDCGGELVEVDSGKADICRELLEDISADESVVVFTRFTADVTRIKGLCTKIGREAYELSGRVNELREWQESKAGAVIVCNIRSGGVGVDMTRARYCIYYSTGFSLGDYEQSLARTHRPGQTKSVCYYHITANGTVDETVAEALKQKKDIVTHVLEGVKNGKRV